MSWDKDHYPDSVKGFNPVVRAKALELINDLMDGGTNETDAISFGTQLAINWAHENGIDTGTTPKS